nr:immunoglobulin heavy chain junction region [Macaca mulatta]
CARGMNTVMMDLW